MIVDLDASLVEIHSENKDGAAAHFKGGYGFHPVFCFADATGEALAGELRPGNATANDSADLLGILDRGIAQLPVHIRTGHHRGDDPGLVERPVVVRSDSAGDTKVFAKGCRDRNIGFQVVIRRQDAVSAAIAVANIDPQRWETALVQDGTETEHVTSSA